MFKKVALVVAVSVGLTFSQTANQNDSLAVAKDKKAQKIALLIVSTVFVAVLSVTAKTISSGKLVRN